MSTNGPSVVSVRPSSTRTVVAVRAVFLRSDLDSVHQALDQEQAQAALDVRARLLPAAVVADDDGDLAVVQAGADLEEGVGRPERVLDRVRTRLGAGDDEVLRLFPGDAGLLEPGAELVPHLGERLRLGGQAQPQALDWNLDGAQGDNGD